jgi:hypothetical protein
MANRTQYVAGIAPSMDKTGLDWGHVVVKGTFTLSGKAPPVPAQEQLPLWAGDQPLGDDPATSSIRYASDLGPAKTGTDIALLGHAYAPGGRSKSCDVGLQVASAQKVLRVFGERRWYRSVVSWVATAPIDFDRMPLVWERAYGGKDDSHPDPSKHAVEQRNPVGTGFAASDSKARLEGLALPNLEDPRHPITAWNQRPTPVCLGFLGPHWLPRRSFAGTYDAAWQKQRLPLLPLDFDERFHNVATPELAVRPHLVGGEQVAAVGVSPDGPLSFALPREALSVSVWLRGKPSRHRPVLDTVVIEPDERRVSLTWRASFPCPRQFLQVEAVVVDRETPR